MVVFKVYLARSIAGTGVCVAVGADVTVGTGVIVAAVMDKAVASSVVVGAVVADEQEDKNERRKMKRKVNGDVILFGMG